MTIEICPVCGNGETLGTRIGIPMTAQWNICATCGLLYEAGSADLKKRYYAEFQESNGILPSRPFNTREEKIARAIEGSLKYQWHTALDYIRQRMKIPDKGAILEIGFGGAEILAYAKALGFSATGFEIGIDYVIFARSLGLDVHLIDVSSATIPDLFDSFDAVIANEVMEHVQDPRAFTRGLRSYLKPKTGQLWLKFAHPDVEELHTGEWHYWSTTAACMLLESAGFEVTSLNKRESAIDLVALRRD